MVERRKAKPAQLAKVYPSASIGTSLADAALALSSGGLVAIPTETVYGLAANAYDGFAVAKIFEVKKRPTFNPLIVHTYSKEAIDEFATGLEGPLLILAEALWPGPLTLLLPKKSPLPDIVSAGNEQVAVRIPNHPLTLALLQGISFPLAAPSANPSGYVSPTTAAHVAQQLGTKLSYILDGGPCEVGIESTIVGMHQGKLTLFRQGGISLEVLEELVGPLRVMPHSSSQPKAPGSLQSHYAPHTNLLLGNITEQLAFFAPERVAILSLATNYAEVPPKHQVQLSVTKNLAEAAQNLFAALRKLDALGLDIILAEPMPELGLGRAINDRLRRAEANYLSKL